MAPLPSELAVGQEAFGAFGAKVRDSGDFDLAMLSLPEIDSCHAPLKWGIGRWLCA